MTHPDGLRHAAQADPFGRCVRQQIERGPQELLVEA